MSPRLTTQVPEATQEEWVKRHVKRPVWPACAAQAVEAEWPRLAAAPGSPELDLALLERRAQPSRRSGPLRSITSAPTLCATQVQSTSGLYKERIVYLGQEIDDLVINQIISVMLFADAEDATKEQVWG